MARPTKSAWAWAGSASAAAASGEFTPKTLGTSGPVFSRTALAVATRPTSQPARVAGSVGVEIPEAVRHRHTHPISIHSREGAQDSGPRVRNDAGVIVGENGALAPDEVQEGGYLLQVGGNVRVVATKVGVVELDVDDSLNPSSSGIQHAGCSRLGGSGQNQAAHH